jgi:hypothetical protein
MPFILNLPLLSRLRKEALAREDFVGEYHYGMCAIAGGFLWGAILSVPSFILGWMVFVR